MSTANPTPPDNHGENSDSAQQPTRSNGPTSPLSQGLSGITQKIVGKSKMASRMIQLSQQISQAFQRVKKISTNLWKVVKGFIQFMATPPGWITALAILVILLLVTSMNVYGKSENGSGCDSATGDNTGVQATLSTDQTQTANSIGGWMMSTDFSFLGGKPLSLNQSAAIIGNLTQESGLKPTAVNASSGATGIAQWLGSRLTSLKSFASSQGGSYTDLNVQLNFLKSELDGSYGSRLVASGFNDNSKSVEDLTTIFETVFEGAGAAEANIPKRVSGANAFLANFNGGYSSQSGGSCLTADSGTGSQSGATGKAAELIQFAEQYLGSSYVWAASDPVNRRFDCSGFTMFVYGHFGITLPHQSQAQAAYGKAVSSLSDAQPGDLLVLGASTNPPSGHVGIYIGNGNMINALSPQRGLIENPVSALGQPSQIRRLLN